MTITEFSIKRPSLVIVVFTGLILGGIFSYTNLSYELMPDMSMPTFTITTQYPGAAPSDVEQTVTRSVEGVLSGLSGINQITSQSMEGASVITAQFDMGTDIDEMQQEVQRQVNNILKDLPEDVEPPSVTKLTISDRPIIQLTATSDLNPARFYDLVDNEILPQFQQISGVAEIVLLGGQQREIQVNIQQDKLQHYGLSLQQVTQAIGQANTEFPTGRIETREEQMTVRLAGRFDSVEQIEQQVIVVPRDGSPIRVEDVAVVNDAIKEPASVNRLNGQNGIGLQIKKQSDANAVEISEEVQSRIAALEEQFVTEGLHIAIANDTSVFTLEAADAVIQDLIVAMILVSIVILFFLHSLRDSLIVLISIPTSLISTFVAIYLFGFSLNLMTLLGLTLVVGILVDASIVILENIHRHLDMGKDRVQASLAGVREIGFAVVAMTLVVVVVFAPISIIQTTIGQILREFSLTVVVATLMSLLVCFTLVPWLTSRFSRVFQLDTQNWYHKPLIWFETGLDWFTNHWYTRQLKWTLNHKLITGLFVLFLLILTGFVMQMGIIGQEMIARGDRGEFLLSLEYDRHITLTENNLRTRAIEEYLAQKEEVRNIYANIGGAASGRPGSSGGIGSVYKSELTVGLVDEKDRDQSTEEYMRNVREELRDKFPGVRITSSVIGMMAASEAPVQVILSSEDQEKLMSAANELRNRIERMAGAIDVSLSVEEGNPEVNIQLNREKMARMGLNIATVGANLRNSLAGNTDTKYRAGDNEYDINIRLDAFDRRNPSDVQDLSFLNDQGQLINLSQFATLTQSTGPSVLERIDRRRSVTVRSNVMGISSGELSDKIEQNLREDSLPEGVEWRWTGDVERMQESFSALFTALIAALVLVYLILVALYDDFIYPFVAAFGIPPAFIGAFLILNLTMSNLSIFAILGVIMLFGVVTNNAILIVDFANQKKAEGMDTFNALVEAGRIRMRPILMTTLSMVIGLFPVALATGAGAEWKNGLAWVLIGGLTSSLILTVFIVPVMYAAVDELRAKLNLGSE